MHEGGGVNDRNEEETIYTGCSMNPHGYEADDILVRVDGASKKNKATSNVNARYGWELNYESYDNTIKTHSQPTLANSPLLTELQAIWSAIKEAQAINTASHKKDSKSENCG